MFIILFLIKDALLPVWVSIVSLQSRSRAQCMNLVEGHVGDLPSWEHSDWHPGPGEEPRVHQSRPPE